MSAAKSEAMPTWNGMTQVGNPLNHEENVCGRTDLHTKCIPITVHGDGTPIVRHSHLAAQMKAPVVGFPAFLLVHHRYCLLIGTHTTKGRIVMSMRWPPEIIGMHTQMYFVIEMHNDTDLNVLWCATFFVACPVYARHAYAPRSL